MCHPGLHSLPWGTRTAGRLVMGIGPVQLEGLALSAGNLAAVLYRGLDWLPGWFLGSSRGLAWGGVERDSGGGISRYGAKADEIYGRPRAAVPSVSLVVKSARFVCKTAHWEPRPLLPRGCSWQPLLFFLVPGPLCASQPCQSEWVKVRRDLHEVP